MQDIDIRLMVLYALNKAGIALEEDRLCGLIATAAPVSYFFVMQQLPPIAESGNIVRYEEDAAGDEIIRALGRMKYCLKSKTLRGSKTELAVELFCRTNDTAFLEKIRAVKGVNDVTLIQYNGEYHG